MAAFGSRGAGYGLDAELCRQREAKYDYDAEDSARVCSRQYKVDVMHNCFILHVCVHTQAHRIIITVITTTKEISARWNLNAEPHCLVCISIFEA